MKFLSKALACFLFFSISFIPACKTGTANLADSGVVTAGDDLQQYDYQSYGFESLLRQIKEMNSELKGHKGALTQDQSATISAKLKPLIQQYLRFNNLKFDPKSESIVLAPKSKTVFKYRSYCLNSGAASPSSGERFTLSTQPPDIPLYVDVMRYTNLKSSTKINFKQGLLWNLKNDVMFENLPDRYQEFLIAMDPLSYVKLNNKLKAKLNSEMNKLAKKHIPFYSEAKSSVNLVKGTAYTYEQYANNVESLVSKFKLSDKTAPLKAEGSEIHTLTKSSGYSGTVIYFFNYTDTVQYISIYSYLKPLRKDVQPIGLDLPEIFNDKDKYKDEIIKEFADLIALIEQILGIEPTSEDITKRADDVLKIIDTFNNAYAMKTEKSPIIYTDIAEAFHQAYWSAITVRDFGDELARKIISARAGFVKPLGQDIYNKTVHNYNVGIEIGMKLKDQGIYDNNSYAEEVLKNITKLKTI